jgi:hypothetical protein
MFSTQEKDQAQRIEPMYKHMLGRRDIMTQEELEEELVWDKLQTGDYIDIDGKVYEMETGELICENMS